MLVQALTREAARQGRMIPAASLKGYAGLARVAV
jgi:hypothetical protein